MAASERNRVRVEVAGNSIGLAGTRRSHSTRSSCWPRTPFATELTSQQPLHTQLVSWPGPRQDNDRLFGNEFALGQPIFSIGRGSEPAAAVVPQKRWRSPRAHRGEI
jgi:hypothetical protein